MAATRVTAEIGASRERRAGGNQFPRAEFLEKFRNMDDATLVKLANAKQRTYHFEQAVGILYLLCTCCGKFLEATTDNFTATNVWGDKKKWFDSMPHTFQLGSNGCNACHARKAKERDSDGDNYLQSLGHRYPAIWHVYTEAEKEAIKAQYRAEHGREWSKVPQSDSGLAYLKSRIGQRCPISGAIMDGIKGSPFCVCVNSLVLQTSKYDPEENHELHQIQIVATWVNVRQRDVGIPCLLTAFRHMFATINQAPRGQAPEVFARATESFGARSHGPLISHLASNGVKADKFKQVLRGGKIVWVPRETPRLNNLGTSAEVAAFLLSKGMRCATSGVVVTVTESAWNTAHLDRINDADGHNTDNVEVKCRLFMGRTKVSRKQFLEMFLHQTLEPASAEARTIVEAELATT